MKKKKKKREKNKDSKNCQNCQSVLSVSVVVGRSKRDPIVIVIVITSTFMS